MKTSALWLCALLAGASAQAQTVYRCGSDGHVYSQTPCPQGKAVNVSDDRSPEQRAAAHARVRDDQALGDALERERLNREAGKPLAAGKIDGRPAPAEPPTPKKSKAPKKKKTTRPQQKNDDFKAIPPTEKHKKRA